MMYGGGNMKSVFLWLKDCAWTNVCAFFMYMVSPMAWTSPFGVAFLAAAGHAEMRWDKVFIGSILGALLGKGGLGGIAGGLMAYTLSGIFHKRGTPNPKSTLSVSAFVCCLIPAYAYHLPYSAYDAVAATFASLTSMAACPAISPALMMGVVNKIQLNPEERIASFVVLSLMLSGLTEWYAPAGCFFAGLVVLILSSGGMISSLAGALTAAVGLLIGSASANECALLLFVSAAAGAVSRYGLWAQSAIFLIGIPLSAYFGFHINSACLLLSAAVYPWIPRALTAQACRYLGFFDETRHMFLTASTARRHIAPRGVAVSGDSGLIERLPGGRILFMLADGMGTGAAAREMSDRVIGYAKNVFYAPVSTEEAMICINALSRREKEMHSTMDICLLDTITGKCEFIKNGAEPSWILSRYEIRRIEGEALPLGAVESAPSSHTGFTLSPGDSVVMVTDGLIHALGGADNTEKFLFENKSASPLALCAQMIRKAKSAPAAMQRDDMSAMCIKIGGRSAWLRAVRQLPGSIETIGPEKKAG